MASSTERVGVAAAGLMALALAAPPAQAQWSEGIESDAIVGGITIRYAIAGPQDGEAVVLIGGTATQLTDWPASLIDGLVGRGFRVIAFDHRDSGLSTHFDKAGVPDLAALFADLTAGRTPSIPYTLRDMSNDVLGLLDALSVPRAHLFGASMGGMIAQIIAAENADRALSLVSVMAGSGNPAIRIPADPLRLARVPPPPPAGDTAAAIERQLALWKALGSPDYPIDEATLRTRVVAAVARSYDPAANARQGAAVLAAGDRREQLRTIRVPAIVIHGAEDPLVPVEAGREVANLVPDAELRIVPGLGHDMPDTLVPLFIDAIGDAAARSHRGAMRDRESRDRAAFDEEC